jgi:hypothetical protein
VVTVGARAPGRRTRRGGHRDLGHADLAGVKRTAAEQGAWICFADESGQSLRPPKGRTWAPRGQTPVVTVSGKGSGRVSVAGLICVKLGQRTRLIYRTITYRDLIRREEWLRDRRTVDPADGRSQPAAGADRAGLGQLRIPRRPQDARVHRHRDWLTVFRLPAYAPELNPTEDVWANLKGQLRNLAVRGVDQLTVIIKGHLKRMQYRPSLLDGIIAGTGLRPAEPP